MKLLLLAAWAALTVAALGFVFALGTNSPNADEWEFVPALTGHEPLVPWLWAQHNEHRLPLPRLVYYTLFRLAHDFRAGMVLQISLLSGLSLGLMRLAARLRGRPHWADVFFSLSLLHVGHWENLLLGYNICFAFILTLETAIGLVALVTTRETLFRSGFAAGVLAAVLSLCGGGGVVTALPVAAWVAYLAVLVGRDGAKVRAAILLLLAAFPVVYLVIYLDGYHRPPHHEPLDYGSLNVALVTGEVLTMAFGYGVAKSWAIALAAVLLLGLVTLAALATDVKSPPRRPGALGLMAIIAGIVGVALVIGMGRAWIGPKSGLSSRYGYIVWPLLGLAFVFWAKRGGWGGKWVPAALCVGAALAFPSNMMTGVHAGTTIRAVLAQAESETRAGVPPEQIVRDWSPTEDEPGKPGKRGTFQAFQEARAIRAIPMLRAAKVGAFAGPNGEGNPDPWWIAAGVVVVVLVGLGVRWVTHLGRAVQVERARELFRLQHERFEEMLLTAATGTGKPRGLSWVGCEIVGDAVIARDVAKREIVALVPVVIRFEPVAGSDMEDVPMAREPRQATAVFAFHRGHWHTDGRVVFNLDPRQAAAHFGPQLVVIEPHQ